MFDQSVYSSEVGGGGVVFPLPLSVFERYMFLDDCAGNTMTLPLSILIDGVLDCVAIERSYFEACELHPLFCATISKRDYCWHKVAKPDGIIWLDAGVEYIFPWEEQHIDITQSTGLRFAIQVFDNSCIFYFLFHHCLSDGIGFFQFIETLFECYLKNTGQKITPKRYDATNLNFRSKYKLAPPPKRVTLFSAVKFMTVEIFRWLIRRPLAPISQELSNLASQMNQTNQTNQTNQINQTNQTNQANQTIQSNQTSQTNHSDRMDQINRTEQTESASSMSLLNRKKQLRFVSDFDIAGERIQFDLRTWDNSGFIFVRLSSNLTSGIICKSKRNKFTIGDILLSGLFISLAGSRHLLFSSSGGVKSGGGDDLLRIGLVNNMRGEGAFEIPACNIISYSFPTRRFSECCESKNFYKTISEELRYIKDYGVGKTFIDGLSIFMRFPYIMGKFIYGDRCLASVILSSMNRLELHFSSKFSRDVLGRVCVGGMTLVDFSTAAPFRRGTPISVTTNTYNGQLGFFVQYDAKKITQNDAAKWLAEWLNIIAKENDEDKF
ncbi:MAG: hypothetical protein LBP59_12415 [Planctomycetaceae bacterium]|jgi:hypothetical protein|nr:hypothetical protein [Planctomycetaceae bacterium]